MLYGTYRRYVVEPEMARPVSVRLPRDVARALDCIAREADTTRSAVIREYLVESLPAEYLEPPQ